MNRWTVRVALALLLLMVTPFRSPAPLIYRPGEGWTYETYGGEGSWRRNRAKDQLEIAQKALDGGNYSLALKSARRVVSAWPLSDFAPQAQYIVGRAYEAKKQDERAFNEYQKALTKYPRLENQKEILQRQFEIANRFLGGQWFKLWGYIPFFPSMDKTADMYAKIVGNGPYSSVAPTSQMNIGTAREKQKEYPLAVKAYLRAADRYRDMPTVSADALFKAGLAYQKQARTADYDQNIAGDAINTFSDFATIFPNDARVNEARTLIATLRAEQAKGAFATAKYYEKHKHWDGALIYYNEAILRDPQSKYASLARSKIEQIKQKRPATPAPAAAEPVK
jgi:outer membrane protein assembly factor BamD (BamD/ComL family)